MDGGVEWSGRACSMRGVRRANLERREGKRGEERVVFMPLLHPIFGKEITVLSMVNDSVHSRGNSIVL